jgi:hypothetical protein
MTNIIITMNSFSRNNYSYIQNSSKGTLLIFSIWHWSLIRLDRLVNEPWTKERNRSFKRFLRQEIYFVPTTGKMF